MKKKMRCFRCSGRKKVFKIGSGYTLVYNGSVAVDCPMCKGEGTVDDMEAVNAKRLLLSNEVDSLPQDVTNKKELEPVVAPAKKKAGRPPKSKGV